jgi:outer membrane biosynthesis protein TonB
MMGHNNAARRIWQALLPQRPGNGIPLRMTFGRQLAVFLVALGLLLGTACHKKKQVAQYPKVAPTLDVEVPDRIPEQALPAEPPPAQEEAKAEEPPPKKKPPKRRSAPKVAPPPASNQSNTTVAVNRPPATEAPVDTAIAADVPNEKLLQQKQTTSDLLDSTEKNLKVAMSHQLTADEEAMATQVKSYIAQSRKATSDGDYERAFNLAKKAQLLADALVKK